MANPATIVPGMAFPEVRPAPPPSPPVRHRRPQTPGQVLAPRLGLGQAKLMGEHLLVVHQFESGVVHQFESGGGAVTSSPPNA
jgi:hypothetical protein